MIIFLSSKEAAGDAAIFSTVVLCAEFDYCLCILVGLTLGMYIVAHLTPYEWNLNFSCCTAHQPHPAAQFSPASSPVELANNYSFWNTLW